MVSIREVFSLGKYIVPGSMTIIYFIILILPTTKYCLLDPGCNVVEVPKLMNFFEWGLSLEQLRNFSEIIVVVIGAAYIIGFIMYIVYSHYEDEKFRRNTYAMMNLNNFLNIKGKEHIKDDFFKKFAFYDLICYSEFKNVNNEFDIKKFVSLIEKQWDYFHTTYMIGKLAPVLAIGTFVLYLIVIRPKTGIELLKNFHPHQPYWISFWIFYIFFVFVLPYGMCKFTDRRIEFHKKLINSYQEILLKIKKDDIEKIQNKV